MGKVAPAFVTKNLRNGEFQKNGCETVIHGKHYIIGGSDDESGSPFRVQILDESSGEWITPTVLGTKPNSCKGYSVVPLNDHRILIIKEESTPDDCIWFLEVDTPYVREQKKKLETEIVAWSKGVRGNAEKPVVISGPSGVGKGTLISMLMKEFPTMFGFSVSHTTRAPRNTEKDGVHYHFTEKSVMEMEIKNGKFLEFASVHGNLYGTSIEAVEVVADAGKKCILDIDVQGARSVRDSSLEAIFIFVCPPSMEELEKRLRARGTEAEEAIIKRLNNAKAEMEQGISSGIFDHILYNDKLEQCYESLKKLLGLENGVAVAPEAPSSVGINLPSDFSVSKSGNKVIISSEPLGIAKSKKNLLVLDVSSLKGGGPGRTIGLDIYTMEPSSESANKSYNHKLN